MTKAKPIPQELLDKLVYDETSPTCLRWKERHRAAIPEDRRAGSFRKDGYGLAACDLAELKVRVKKIVQAFVVGHAVILIRRSSFRVQMLGR